LLYLEGLYLGVVLATEYRARDFINSILDVKIAKSTARAKWKNKYFKLKDEKARNTFLNKFLNKIFIKSILELKNFLTKDIFENS
jgi:hypothetical protein